MSETASVSAEIRVRYLLLQFLKDSLNQYSIKITKAIEDGENFMGFIFNVTLDEYNLIIKVAPHQQCYRELFPIHEMYQREIFVYNHIIPEFIKLQSERKLSSKFDSFAKHYTSSTDQNQEYLLMENLQQRGFKNGDHRAVLDYAHASLIMKETGKFHALSYALRDQKPELFQNLEKECKEHFFNSSMSKLIIKGLVNLGTAVLDSYDPIQNSKEVIVFKRFLQNLPDIFVSILSPEKAEGYYVINHGDIHMRNLMFKYANSSQPDVPTDLCMIDWQLARLGSPASEIISFLCISTDKDLRKKYYDTLIQDYYNSLSSFLRELGSDPDTILPLQVLLKQLKKFASFGLYMAIWYNATNYKERDNVPDFYNSVNEDDYVDRVSMVPEHKDEYIERIRDLISDLIKYEYEI